MLPIYRSTKKLHLAMMRFEKDLANKTKASNTVSVLLFNHTHQKHHPTL